MTFPTPLRPTPAPPARPRSTVIMWLVGLGVPLLTIALVVSAGTGLRSAGTFHDLFDTGGVSQPDDDVTADGDTDAEPVDDDLPNYRTGECYDPDGLVVSCGSTAAYGKVYAIKDSITDCADLPGVAFVQERRDDGALSCMGPADGSLALKINRIKKGQCVLMAEDDGEAPTLASDPARRAEQSFPDGEEPDPDELLTSTDATPAPCTAARAFRVSAVTDVAEPNIPSLACADTPAPDTVFYMYFSQLPVGSLPAFLDNDDLMVVDDDGDFGDYAVFPSDIARVVCFTQSAYSPEQGDNYTPGPPYESPAA